VIFFYFLPILLPFLYYSFSSYFDSDMYGVLGLQSHETERNIIDHDDDGDLMVAWWRHLWAGGMHIVRQKMKNYGKLFVVCWGFFVCVLFESSEIYG